MTKNASTESNHETANPQPIFHFFQIRRDECELRNAMTRTHCLETETVVNHAIWSNNARGYAIREPRCGTKQIDAPNKLRWPGRLNYLREDGPINVM